MRKLSNLFLSHYLMTLLLTAVAAGLAILLLSFASGLIEGELVKNRYPAEALMRDDYTQIDASPVVRNGGGVQVIDRNYRVVYSAGLDMIQKDLLTAQEFTNFLVGSRASSCHYDIAYNTGGEFWLVVVFPTSLRLDFSVVYNREAASGDMQRAWGVLLGVLVFYLLLLALLTFLASRITAARVTRPLEKLCDGTKLLREGDYSARVELRLSNEFAELQDTFNAMAARIEREMALRKKSEDDRRRLILDISHDLRNPLSSISGFAQWCLTHPYLPAQERDEYLQAIRRNSQTADRLLSELSELSRLESPAFTMKTEKTELCEYLRQVCGELVPLLEKAGFRYDFDIPDEQIYVLADTDRLGRVFQNLAENAVRYNREGTTVTVCLQREGDKAAVRFGDDGIGIPLELAEDIFKPFVRADDSRNSATGGSGLGLSIARRIAEAHGGSLTLESGGPGCMFLLTLPLI